MSETDLGVRKRGLNTKSTQLPFLALNIVFVAYTIDLTARITFVSKLLRGALVQNSLHPLKARFNLANSAALPWNNALNWLTGTNQGILVECSVSLKTGTFSKVL